MTNELEKQFFDTFGIEPKSLFICKRGYNPEVCTQPICKGCNEAIEYGKYPKITDRILLELICIIGDVAIKCTKNKCEVIYSDGAISYLGKDLKEALLNLLISKVLIFKCQVRTLFEEGENER